MVNLLLWLSARKCIIAYMKKSVIVVLMMVAAVTVVVCLSLGRGNEDPQHGEGQDASTVAGDRRAEGRTSAKKSDRAASRGLRRDEGDEEGDSGEMDEGVQQEETEEPTEEEKRQDEEEKMVEDFDALTDKWMEPSDNGVSMKDVDAFAEQFRKVPAARKEECLQRALNLVPDENVMLLAGILMDKEQDKELIELVFNDVLNRDEEVKKPILQQIFKDKEHPCWADTAWILDVTGDSSKQKEQEQ